MKVNPPAKGGRLVGVEVKVRKVKVKNESESESTCRKWASCRSGWRDCEVGSPPLRLPEGPCSAQPEDSEDGDDGAADRDDFVDACNLKILVMMVVLAVMITLYDS